MSMHSYQVADTIHQTIYISDLEHAMMSTPFFYRLHDVYQSSTVYMTFPSNRTKRYEHSLGTMEIAGKMFFSAVTNTTTTNKIKFMSSVVDIFSGMLKEIKNNKISDETLMYNKYGESLSKIISTNKYNLDYIKSLLSVYYETSQNYLFDSALNKQTVAFTDLIFSAKLDKPSFYLYSFLYQCLLEAIRIAALFHDIGHPPFSHILEDVLNDLYELAVSKNLDQKYKPYKINALKESLEKYKSENNIVAPTLLDKLPGFNSQKNQALHEKIGLRFLDYTFNTFVHEKFKNYSGNKTQKSNLIGIYYVTILEFTFAILLNKNNIFSSLHNLIDGVIDADRMDYVMRDSANSGVTWGTIPYTRLINGIKFDYIDSQLIMAFPEKTTNDLDDFLVNRYKVFQRINYHHHSVKTSTLLQKVVRALAEDYLTSDEGKEIAPDIKILWTSLETAFGNNKKENQISRWTDSWLVSVLSSTMSKISEGDDLEEVERSIDIDTLRPLLEEIQLNKKHFYPLLKRQRDALKLKEIIYKETQLNEDFFISQAKKEYDCLVHENDDISPCINKLYLINFLQDNRLKVADFEAIDFVLGTKEKSIDIVKDVLEKHKQNKSIKDYFVCPNGKFSKLGINGKIYLYHDLCDKSYEYDITTSLLPKLNAEKDSCLWLFAYISLLPDKLKKTKDLIFEEIAKDIANAIYSVLNI